MAFFVGQKVVCVDNALAPGAVLMPGERVPSLEDVYTVRETLEWRGTPQIRLVEIVNPPCRRHDNGERGEASFLASRFRPVVEPKTETDIGIFIEMLNKAPKKVTEDA